MLLEKRTRELVRKLKNIDFFAEYYVEEAHNIAEGLHFDIDEKHFDAIIAETKDVDIDGAFLKEFWDAENCVDTVKSEIVLRAIRNQGLDLFREENPELVEIIHLIWSPELNKCRKKMAELNRKLTKEEVANVVASEGLEHAIRYHVSSREIRDRNLADKWKRARNVLNTINRWLPDY